MITINFESVADLEKVLQGLALKPYSEVAPLIANIHGQAMPQISKAIEPTKEENDNA